MNQMYILYAIYVVQLENVFETYNQRLVYLAVSKV